MIQDEYFIIERENNDNYPLVSWDQSSGKFGLGQPIPIEEPIKLRLREPISKNFEWVDYHKLPDPVFSQKVFEALSSEEIYGIQWVPAKVRNPNGGPFDEPKDYWFMHVLNSIACINKEESELEYSRSGDTLFGIEKLVLEEKVLEKVPLDKRLIFELAEDSSVLLIHQSIKSMIKSINATGCRFFKATEWNSDIVFE